MITLSPATGFDAEDLLRWRNDPAARSASGSVEAVSPAQHAAWLDRVLSDGDRFLYIAHDTEAPEVDAKVGMCRFDLGADGRAEVSINLNPASRGRGIARDVLVEGISTFRAEVGIDVRLTATIRPSNLASARIFRSAGFELTGSDDEFDYYLL